MFLFPAREGPTDKIYSNTAAANYRREPVYFPGPGAGVVNGASSCVGGSCGVVAVDWFADFFCNTLSILAAFARGRKYRLMIKLRAMNIPARICVARIRKSAVRRTPKTMPTDPPPNVPANPPPLLDCIKTTRIKRMLTRTSSAINNPKAIDSFPYAEFE
jgi:hypothetical protein